jgi:RimJ/RimL family protein N-acetyltransferase
MCGIDVGIRRFEAGDVPSLFSATRESMAEVRRWMSWCRDGYRLSDALAFVEGCEENWRTGRRYDFAIYDRGDGMILGSVGLSGVDRAHQCANLGYWVRASHTGRGVASGAAGLAVRFGFTELGLNRVEILIAAANAPSIRVAEKIGGQREGVLRRRLLLGGEWTDAIVYSLLCGEDQPVSEAEEVGAAIPALDRDWD